MSLTTHVYKKTDSIVSRRIDEEYILVPISRDAGEVDNIYVLNELSARIWELIDGKNKVGEIRGIIIDEYEVGPEEAENDLYEFLGLLEKIGAVSCM
jgi:hypothetical protein